MFPSVSIIIAAKSNNKYLEECIRSCLNLDYPFFEIIILPDEDMAVYLDPKINIISTGKVLPATKRDIGAAQAKGEILAFLDDDASPSPNWLKNAALGFKDLEVVCVCGPAITPSNEALFNRASGRVYESIIVSGPARFRYVPLKKRFTDDFPSCNFLIRKDVFQEIGGFNTKFWPGEDTILCLEVTHKLKKKIFYDPNVLVTHYRRPLFRKHLSQIANYARHRGYFIKRYPKTSLKIGYFIPTLITLIIGLSLLFAIVLDFRFLFLIYSYLFIVLIFSLQNNFKLSGLVFVGIILTHLSYGFNFLLGLFSKKLKEE